MLKTFDRALIALLTLGVWTLVFFSPTTTETANANVTTVEVQALLRETLNTCTVGGTSKKALAHEPFDWRMQLKISCE